MPDPEGAIAQLGERLLCKQEVVGSIPSGSTRRRPQAPNFVRENINPRVVRSAGARVMSDIVKRRSIRALRVTKVTGCALSPSGDQETGIGDQDNPDARRLTPET